MKIEICLTHDCISRALVITQTWTRIYTQIYLAAQYGNAGADPNRHLLVCEKDGPHKKDSNPLFAAIWDDHQDVVEVLLNGGADPKVKYPAKFEDEEVEDIK